VHHDALDALNQANKTPLAFMIIAHLIKQNTPVKGRLVKSTLFYIIPSQQVYVMTLNQR
jgi:hypothetical protein